MTIRISLSTVLVALADDGGVALGAMFCGLKCASAWLAATPAEFKKKLAELPPEALRAHRKLLEAFAEKEE